MSTMSDLRTLADLSSETEHTIGRIDAHIKLLSSHRWYTLGTAVPFDLKVDQDTLCLALHHAKAWRRWHEEQLRTFARMKRCPIEYLD